MNQYIQRDHGFSVTYNPHENVTIVYPEWASLSSSTLQVIFLHSNTLKPHAVNMFWFTADSEL